MSALKQQNINEGLNDYPLHFSIIRGGLSTANTKRQKRINDFWVFCHATFWSTENFSEDQEAEFKQLIAAHFIGSKNSNNTFKELVQRAALAKRYIRRRNDGYTIRPQDWLNINYRNGLTGTSKWYSDVLQQRATMPAYNQGIDLLAEAVLSFAERRNVLDVIAYREAFIELNQRDLLFLYTNTVVHFQYINSKP